MNVKLKFNTEPLSREFARIAEGARRQAIPRAFNRAATSSRVVMARVVSKEMELKQAVVKDAIKITEATPQKHEAQLTVRSQRVPLIKSKRYPNAFIATMRNGYRGVFQRKGRARLPIMKIDGPFTEIDLTRLPFVFDKYRNDGIAKFEESVMKNLQSEFRFLLRQATA